MIRAHLRLALAIAIYERGVLQLVNTSSSKNRVESTETVTLSKLTADLSNVYCLLST
ncbi:hypothetical protein LCGC14_0810000 [marine sediment metagenome]|uniref:Uncharacterized protein n=1 Tax=marine sediment metagenome TaxID=412755 RepID=A0A0F9PRI9_9ZZZZ